MNKRVKELRNILNLSGEKFGAKIGLTRMAISNIENGKYNLTEQSIKSICREFNVNETWLRTGQGNIFNETLDLTTLAIELDPLELEVLKAYFSLDKDIRKKALEHFKKSLNS